MQEPIVKSIQRISVAADGTQANRGSAHPSLSADGRTVAFSSDASNLVPGDTNEMGDIFVKDLTTGAVIRAAHAAEAYDFHYNPTLSADGLTVAFLRTVPGATAFKEAIFIKNLTTRAVARVDNAKADEGSHNPAMSADGKTVAFDSNASTLVPGDTNGTSDIFVKNLTTGAVTRASVAADGTQANEGSYDPALSADGRTVAFSGYASNLVPGDTNEMGDIFIKDLTTGAITRANVAADGTEANGLSYRPVLSADGKTIAFSSYASNLVPGDTNGASDIFIKDLTTGASTRANVAADGTEANGVSYRPALSADGRTVAFSSNASNLVPGDTNGTSDIFVVTFAWPDISSISGTPGRDILNGTAGNDTINGLGGDDILNGGAGEDVLNGSLGNDVLNGDAGADRLNGQEGADVLNGGSGDDALMGGAGDDVLNGDAGKDELSGAGGNDVLNGGEEDDRLSGGDGADVLNGGRGDDFLDGGSGDDLLDGGAGRDILYGGPGADVFVCRPVPQATPANGAVEWVQWKIEDGGNGHWYAAVLVPEGILWKSAKSAAEDLGEGAHLATIANEEENAFVLSVIENARYRTASGEFWLGGYQAADAAKPEGGWQWITGEPFEFQDWAPGEPNDDGGQDYLPFADSAYGPYGRWDDHHNAARKAFLADSPILPAAPIDRIMDFEDGVDRLDLTAFAFKSLDDLAALIQPKGPDTLIDLSTVGGEDTLIAGINVFELSPDDVLI